MDKNYELLDYHLRLNRLEMQLLYDIVTSEMVEFSVTIDGHYEYLGKLCSLHTAVEVAKGNAEGI